MGRTTTMTTLRTIIRPARPSRIRPICIVLAAIVVVAATYGATVLTRPGPAPALANPTSRASATTGDRPGAAAEILPGDGGGPVGADDLAAIDTQIAIWG